MKKSIANAPGNQPAEKLLKDIHALIQSARGRVAQAVNAGLVTLYWNIGRRIHEDILESKRAEYGERIVLTLSAQLTADYGSNFSEKNIPRMIQLASVFPDEKIVVSLARQLTWTHFLALIPLQDQMQRDFYAEMCRIERWSVRTPPGENRRDALRADGALQEAVQAGRLGA